MYCFVQTHIRHIAEIFFADRYKKLSVFVCKNPVTRSLMQHRGISHLDGAREFQSRDMHARDSARCDLYFVQAQMVLPKRIIMALLSKAPCRQAGIRNNGLTRATIFK
jgi:hypothetical protein